jgi:hypothetical protein
MFVFIINMAIICKLNGIKNIECLPFNTSDIKKIHCILLGVEVVLMFIWSILFSIIHIFVIVD